MAQERIKQIITHCNCVYEVTWNDKILHLFGEWHKNTQYEQSLLVCSDHQYMIPFESEEGVRKQTDELLQESVNETFNCVRLNEQLYPNIVQYQPVSLCHSNEFQHINFVSFTKKKNVVCNYQPSIPVYDYVLQFISTRQGYKHIFIESSFRLPGVDVLQKELTMKRESYESFRTMSLGYTLDRLCNPSKNVLEEPTYSFCKTKDYTVESVNARDVFRLYLYYLWDPNGVKHTIFDEDMYKCLNSKKYDIRFQMLLFLLSFHHRSYDNVPEDGKQLHVLFEKMRKEFSISSSNLITDEIRKDVSIKEPYRPNTSLFSKYVTHCFNRENCNNKQENVKCVFDALNMIGSLITDSYVKQEQIYNLYGPAMSLKDERDQMEVFANILDPDDKNVYELNMNPYCYTQTLLFASLFMDVHCLYTIMKSPHKQFIVYTGSAHTEMLVKIIEILDSSAHINKQSELIPHLKAVLL